MTSDSMNKRLLIAALTLFALRVIDRLYALQIQGPAFGEEQ